jgi:hypothetical protein
MSGDISLNSTLDEKTNSGDYEKASRPVDRFDQLPWCSPIWIFIVREVHLPQNEKESQSNRRKLLWLASIDGKQYKYAPE